MPNPNKGQQQADEGQGIMATAREYYDRAAEAVNETVESAKEMLTPGDTTSMKTQHALEKQTKTDQVLQEAKTGDKVKPTGHPPLTELETTPKEAAENAKRKIEEANQQASIQLAEQNRLAQDKVDTAAEQLESGQGVPADVTTELKEAAEQVRKKTKQAAEGAAQMMKSAAKSVQEAFEGSDKATSDVRMGVSKKGSSGSNLIGTSADDSKPVGDPLNNPAK